MRTSGMQDILKGILKFRARLKPEITKHLESVKDKPKPEAIIFTCVDSRVVTSRITQANPGDYFIVRNPGNLIPNYKLLDEHVPRSEEASIELACQHNDVNTVAVCGHSDCKAMKLVFSLKDKLNYNVNSSDSLLKDWVMVNSRNSLLKYFEAEKHNFKKPLEFSIYNGIKFQAYIDPSNNFDLSDKFSQINTLQQLENLKHFDLMENKFKLKLLNFYAFWFDVYSGEVFMFSFKEKCFTKIDDSTMHRLLQEYSPSLEYAA